MEVSKNTIILNFKFKSIVILNSFSFFLSVLFLYYSQLLTPRPKKNLNIPNGNFLLNSVTSLNEEKIKKQLLTISDITSNIKISTGK